MSSSNIDSIICSAPSNIALIKYMGKENIADNKPSNASISYTLPHLKSFVRVSLLKDSNQQDQWQPLLEAEGQKFAAIKISEKGIQRFLSHVQKIKKIYQFEKPLLIESANNFPSDCGLASSASSFAALTQSVCTFLEKHTSHKLDISQRAELSRTGSGSSCRSFFEPWGLWDAEGVRPVEELPKNLHHMVVIVEEGKKVVSSSEAHKRVPTSLLFQGRRERAELRLKDLIHVLKDYSQSSASAEVKKNNWHQAFQITWEEFWDMHALFLTSRPPFNYLEPHSLKVTEWVRLEWEKIKNGPIVTMDAGANIHLLYQKEDLELLKSHRAVFESWGFKTF